MTEAKWLACADSLVQLDFLARGGAAALAAGGERQLRLFAVACLRRRWRRPQRAARRAAEVAERFADGLATADELAAASVGWPPLPATGRRGPDRRAAADRGAHAVLYRHALTAAGVAAAAFAQAAADPAAERAAQAGLLRCVLGNPFRPVSFSPAWGTPTVVGLAAAVYSDGGFADRQVLAVLADALEDAGCDQADLLGHLRGPGPHVRGCWAVGLILARQ